MSLHIFDKKFIPIYNKRIETCKSCEHINKYDICRICKCYLPIKARIDTENCPLNKWPK